MNFVKKAIEFVMDILETVVFVGSLFIVVYLFIFQPNQIKGISMEPTFQSGDYIFTSKITYRIRKPIRGDVIVFHSPKNNDIEFIKRIIGLPGDIVMIKDSEVYVNNARLEETYIAAKTPLWEQGFVIDGTPYRVPEGDLFVMGDNRPRSSDSRDFGFIHQEKVIGQVFYRYYPSDKMGKIENPLPRTLQSLSTIMFQAASVPGFLARA